MKAISAIVAIAAALTSPLCLAAYTRALTGPVEIDSIYANEWGSPFVTFKAQINSACAGGNGLYLYNIEMAQPSAQFRNNKMAMLMAAKMANKKVTLDYFFDPAIVGWDSCYIHGISIVDQ